MGKIIVKGIKLYAYHGCTDEEQKIGNHYLVDVTVSANLDDASRSDKLKDTVDYVGIYELGKEEMAIKSRLLEHVAQRIIKRFFQKHEHNSYHLIVKVTKLNPPINGIVESVSVELEGGAQNR